MRETPLKYNEDQGLSVILVADGEPHQRSLLKRWLELDGHKVETVGSAEDCLKAMAQMNPSALCVDLHIPSMGGVALLKCLQANRPDLPVIMLSADTDSEDIMTASHLGAYDTLTKPVNRRELVEHARRAVVQHQINSQRAQLKRQTSARRFPGLIGRSAPMMAMLKQLDRLANSDINVLLQGDSGTGKGLVAEAIHRHSERRDGPFVVIDCATTSEDELVGELFGHPGGDGPPLTGAFERAHKGTLFLDELAELNPSLQPRLLRALREHAHKRDAQGPEAWPDFRLITATRRDLREDVERERFRGDLFYEIAVFELHVPGLAERGDDVELLARHFVERFTADPQSVDISADAVALLKGHHWPGNVRELQNTMRHALLICDDERLSPEDLPPGLQRLTPRGAQTSDASTDVTHEAPDAASGTTTSATTPDALSEASAHGINREAQGARRRLPAVTLEALEEMAIKEALERCENNATEAIRQLGLSRATFYRKLKKYGLK